MTTDPDYIKPGVQVRILTKECREQSRKRREAYHARRDIDLRYSIASNKFHHATNYVQSESLFRRQ